MSKTGQAYDWRTPPSATGAPPRLTVATCQFPVEPDPPANLGHILELIRRAAGSGADLAHFPECALSGYGTAAWPSWDGFDWAGLDDALAAVRQAARDAGIWVALGSACRRPAPASRPLNSLHVIDRGGNPVARYDKRRCSMNDLRAFVPGTQPVVVDIEGVRCGLLICLDWSFPELWQNYAADGVEVILISSNSDRAGRPDRHAAHTIPPLMQGYAFLHGFAISLSNSCRPCQDFPSQWIERSGHKGGECRRDQTGLTLNALADDAAQDAFFEMVREFRRSASDGSLYAPHLEGQETDAG
jgi:predicted amidohydrolase